MDEQNPTGSKGKTTCPPMFGSPEEMVEFARVYFATDFPNPERKGCPIEGEIVTLVRAGEQHNAELNAHLFGCSDCFREFCAAMDARTLLQGTDSWWGRLAHVLTLRPATALACAFSLLIVALVSLYGWRVWHESKTSEVAGSPPSVTGESYDDASTPIQTTRTTPQ